MATGKEEFHTINYYLYLGRTGARTSKSGTYPKWQKTLNI